MTDGTQAWWRTGLWLGHGVLRCWLLVQVLAYGWAKVVLLQMGPVDHAQALRTLGEKSPMGLLWIFMGYSPTVEILAGLIEVLAGILLIWRRTAWVGGLVGLVSMSVVFVLNLAFDVGVQGLALAMAVGFLLVTLPEAPRLLRFVAGRPTGEIRVPRPVPWPRVHRVSGKVLAALGLLVALAGGAAAWTQYPPPTRSTSPLAGVYRVVDDAAPPAARLAEDRRWQAVAFGQWRDGDADGRFAVRRADGSLEDGTYRHVGDGTVEITVSVIRPGARIVDQRKEEQRRSVLRVAPRPDGRMELSGDGQRLVVAPDPRLSALLDGGRSAA